MVANVVGPVRALFGLVCEIGIRASVVPELDALPRRVPMKEVVVFFGERAVSAGVEDTAKPSVCTAALIRVQMQHPLSVAPCL